MYKILTIILAGALLLLLVYLMWQRDERIRTGCCTKCGKRSCEFDGE